MAMEQKIDALLQVGDAAYSMLGLLNQTSTNTYVVPNGALGSPLWTQKTSGNPLLDLNGIAKAAHIATKSADMSTKCCFRSTHATDQHQAAQLDQRYYRARFFLGTSRFIKSVEPWYGCDTAGALGVKRAVAYRPDVDAVFYKMPREFMMLPPETRPSVCDPMRCGIRRVHARKPKTITTRTGSDDAVKNTSKKHAACGRADDQSRRRGGSVGRGGQRRIQGLRITAFSEPPQPPVEDSKPEQPKQPKKDKDK